MSLVTFKLPMQIFRLFTQGEKYSLLLLVFLNISSSVLETVGIGAVLPLVITLSDPAAIHQSGILQRLYEFLHPLSEQMFMMELVILLMVFLIFKNLYVFGSIVYQQIFLRRKYLSMSEHLYHSYLHRPYNFFFNTSSAELLRNVQSIQWICIGVLNPMLILISELITVGMIMILLLIIDFYKTLFIVLFMGALVSVFLVLLKKYTLRIGEQRLKYEATLIGNLMQSLGSIKETRILGVERFFQSNFRTDTQKLSSCAMWLDIFSSVPRFFIESMSVILIFGLMLYMISSDQKGQTLIIELSIFGLAAVRLMPSVSRISVAINNIRCYLPPFNAVYSDIVKSYAEGKNQDIQEIQNTLPVLKFEKEITIENLCFGYNEDKSTLSNINLKIPRYAKIGLIGASGAGKSTLIDLLLGLLTPQKGAVLVDGCNIADNLRSWQRLIGYIPQKIFIFNDTVRRNIAMGIADEKIDEAKVIKAAQIAQLDQLLTRLEDGLNTMVGEGGIKLSGGERQRLGIARALYNDPEILIMDEATAALDNATENEFIEAVKQVAGHKTLIMIAHRLTTVRDCDKIILLQNGVVLAQGTYEELSAAGLITN